MKKTLLLFLFLGIGIVCGLFIYHDPGFAFFRYQDWSVEMPLWIVLLGIILLVISSIYLVIVWRWLCTFGQQVEAWRKRTKFNESKANFLRGFTYYLIGKYREAEHIFLRTLFDKQMRHIQYMMAGIAAHKQQRFAKREHYLKLAAQELSDKLPVKLLQSRLYREQGEYEQAFVILKELFAQHPHHPQILLGLKEVSVALKEWQALSHLFVNFKQAKIMPEEELIQLEKRVYLERFLEAKEKDPKRLISLWLNAPKMVQSMPQIIMLYAKELIQAQKEEEACVLIEKHLKKHWDSGLVAFYGTTFTKAAEKQLENAENWLKKHPDDAVLLLTLGRLCFKRKMWGKANDYLQASLANTPSVEAYDLLGHLAEKMNEPAKALGWYKKASACQMSAV